MSGYDELIKKLKAKLDGFGSTESEIAKRYESARSERTKQFEKMREDISSKRDAAIRDAATNKQKSEKDISQFHESRGLTRSGEAVSEALNRELIEADAIRDAKREHHESTEKLRTQYESDIQALTNDEISEKREGRKDFEDEIFELEKLKLKEAGSEGGESGGGGDVGKGEYEPSISESVLATRLFNTFKDDNGKLSADGQRELKLYLEKLREENGLSDDYMKNLIFALKSYGYESGTNDEEIDGSFESIERAANESSAKVEDMMYKFYRSRGASDGAAMAEAKKHAIWAKLDVIYKNSVSRDKFIYLARKMGSSMSTIYQYFDRVEDVNKYDIDGGIYFKEK